MPMAPPAKPKPLTPAALAAARFGGYKELAVALGVQRDVVWRWIHEADRGIPWRRQKQILTVAKAAGIVLTADEMIHGGLP